MGEVATPESLGTVNNLHANVPNHLVSLEIGCAGGRRLEEE